MEESSKFLKEFLIDILCRLFASLVAFSCLRKLDFRSVEPMFLVKSVFENLILLLRILTSYMPIRIFMTTNTRLRWILDLCTKSCKDAGIDLLGP